MAEILCNPHLWFFVTLFFNIGHTLFHIAFFRGYHGKYSSVSDGIVGYLGAISMMIFLYMDRGTVQFPELIAIPIGLALFIGGIYIHFKAQSDFHKYGKKMTLISKGIYRHFRHPMYLGWSITVIGAAIVSRSFLGLITFWIWILLIAVCGYLEGVKLRNDLPEGEYDEYSKKTWL